MPSARLAPLLLLAALLAGCAGGAPEPPAVRVSYSDLPAEAVAPPGEPEPAAAVVRTPPPPPAPEIEEELLPPLEPAAETLARSLEAYESAGAFWEGGSFEDAFAALDRAYELMASVEVDGDAGLGQQKEDLRRLISRRVVEIYASLRTVVGRVEDSIPLVLNDHVRREIESFRTVERESFLAGYERSGRYRPMIVAQLAERGMPEQLSWLPMVESWFKVKAFSRARALGMWQFIASTGYRFGLERSEWRDERMDPEKSTAAALAYLTELHELFGDWMTALAAYNCGEARVLRTIRAQRVGYFDQFWDLYELLPRETRRFVPRFLATLAIVEDPRAHGFDDLPRPLPPLSYDLVELTRPVRLADLEQATGLVPGTLAELNPELRLSATPATEYELKVPVGAAATMTSRVASLPVYKPPVVQTSIHRVRPGETLSTIANRYGTSVSALMRLNSLRDPNRIWPGQQLRVTGSRAGVATTPLAPGEKVTYTVRTGDSLWRIASRFGTTVDRIKRDNGLRSNTLQPGQRLTVGGSGTASGGTYVVRRGDTLSAIAERARVSLSRLTAANGLSRRSTIYPGQRLVIPE
ncbi:MAG: LysM peptidoglycan-binding domain-containing protein [Thermoanaerobaculia bacterium]|nr:LysM peptidoglycan-binding domain-containing protein [Thermoanaerobaculia bacterium]